MCSGFWQIETVGLLGCSETGQALDISLALVALRLPALLLPHEVSVWQASSTPRRGCPLSCGNL